jgi:hypothetical protein
MRRGAPVLFAAAAVMMGAQGVLACDVYQNTTFHTIPTNGWTIGAGVQIDHVSGSNAFTASGDESFKLGEKAVIRPTAGLCHYSGNNQALFGAGVGVNLWNSNDGKLMLNGQSGLTYSSKSGTSMLNVPIVGALRIAGSNPNMGFFAGGGLDWSHSSTKVGSTTFSGSSTDPIVFGGVNLGSGDMNFTAGLGFWLGSTTETLINAGISIPMTE